MFEGVYPRTLRARHIECTFAALKFQRIHVVKEVSMAPVHSDPGFPKHENCKAPASAPANAKSKSKKVQTVSFDGPEKENT